MHTPHDALVAVLDELEVLSTPSGGQRAVVLRQRLGAGDLRVALVGEAKRGKSTLGNALVGEQVLPTGVIPVTAISTEVRAGSPRRAEITFTDGSAPCTIDVREVETYVSERFNAGNFRHVDRVSIFTPNGMPHPPVVLVDTPGVGSVHRHNTEQAHSAFANMDAAVFVLSADPPISASELELLRTVTDLAVRTFIVLNKADQLDREELGEATGFVSDVVADASGTRPRVWVCSARNALRARNANDATGWGASGVPALVEALLDHLAEHRERDLRVSIASSASRLAAQQLDAVNVTVAAVEALDADEEHRVSELGARLHAVDDRGDQAAQFITANLARVRSRMDAAAAGEVAPVEALVQDRLSTFLATARELNAADLEEQGRGEIAETTQSAVEAWRERWHVQLNEALQRLLEVEQNLLREASGDLQAAAHELLGVRLSEEIPQLTSPTLAALRYDFNPEVGWNQPWVSGLRTHAPARVARRRVSLYLQTEAGRLVDKHMGRARAGFQDRLEEAGRRLRGEVADAFTELSESLRTGHRAALETRRSTDPEQLDVRRSLYRQRTALEGLADRLRQLAEYPGVTGHVLGDDVAPISARRPH